MMFSTHKNRTMQKMQIKTGKCNLYSCVYTQKFTTKSFILEYYNRSYITPDRMIVLLVFHWVFHSGCIYMSLPCTNGQYKITRRRRYVPLCIAIVKSNTMPIVVVVVVFFFQYNQSWTSLPSIVLSWKSVSCIQCLILWRLLCYETGPFTAPCTSDSVTVGCD